MKYIKATTEHTDKIWKLVQETITEIYPQCYPKEVVDFFCQLHSKENICKDIENGLVGVLVIDNQIVGTGSHKDNHITRVYVAPKFQRQGYGTYIMECLEKEISLKYDIIYLDSSIPAKHMYEKLGYRTIKNERWAVESDVVLEYEVMEKQNMIKIRPAVTSDTNLLSQHDKHISKEELQNSIRLGRIYIIENEGHFCGWLRYNLFWDNTPFMNMLFMLEGERGKGYGKEIVSHWERQMKAAGYEVVMTSTQENEDAKYFYEKLGYKNVGGFYPVDDGYELIMAKQI